MSVLYDTLIFTEPLSENTTQENEKIKINPKRVQREISKEMKRRSISTKSEKTLQLSYERNNKEHREIKLRKSEESARLKFILKQKKRKAKHKGR